MVRMKHESEYLEEGLTKLRQRRLVESRNNLPLLLLQHLPLLVGLLSRVILWPPFAQASPDGFSAARPRGYGRVFDCSGNVYWLF